jgi:hypothetical protein
VSKNLSVVAQPQIDIVHVNIGFKKPVSDHDPVLAAFTLPAKESTTSSRLTVIEPTAARE